MPGGSRKSREKPSCEPTSAKSKPSRGSPKTSTASGREKKKADSTTEESGAHRRSTSSSSHAKSIPTSHQIQAGKQLGSALTLPSAGVDPKSQTGASSRPSVTLTGGSTTYLDQQVKKHLLQRKKELLGRFMALIEECLDKKLEPLEEPCDGEGCSSHQLSRSHGSSGGKVGNPSKRQSIGQKRQIQRDDSDGNETEDDDDSRRNRNNKRPKTASDDKRTLKYACPYYKHDPERFEDSKTCSGPGWNDIHRVKEHLKRVHLLPEFQCQRCFQSFKKKAELVKHQRAPQPCPVKDHVSSSRDLADGFNSEQKEKLEKRTRNKPGHDRWIEWYCILFDVEPSSANVPSPYRRVLDSSNWRDGHTSRSQYAEYLDHLRREISSQVRYQLEIEVDKYLSGCENSIRLNFLNKLPNIATSVHRVFQNIPPPPGLIGEHGAGETGNTDLPIPPGFDPAQLFEGSAILEGLESELQPGDGFDFNCLGNPDCFDGSSHTSDPSDGFHATTASSNTSLDETPAKGQPFIGQQGLVVSPQLSKPPFDLNYYCTNC